MEASKAYALLNGRTFVIPDDIKALSHSVLRHRIMLSFEAISDNILVENLIDIIVGAVQTP